MELRELLPVDSDQLAQVSFFLNKPYLFDVFDIDGNHYQRLPLYEADYQPEKLQFYRLVDIPFARKLRKIGADHPFGATP